MTGEFSVAVHALVYLLHKGCAVSSGELAENICTNPARVRKVMACLHRAGLVESHAGRGSGYVLRGSRDTTLEEVLDAVGDTAVPAAWQTGDMDRECLIASGMGRKMDGICRELDELCRVRLRTITVGMVQDDLFRGKAPQEAENPASGGKNSAPEHTKSGGQKQ